MGEFLDAALKWVARGWSVFPLQPRTKIPFPGSNGEKDATRNEEQVRKWWTEHPDANIAGATGPSGRVILDIDPGKGGEDNFKNLVATVGEPAFDTFRTITGGASESGVRGRHFHYLRPPGMNITSGAAVFGTGLDLRASTGYIVLPPSAHPSGRRYEWPQDPNKPELPLPDELLATLREHRAARDIDVAAFAQGRKIRRGQGQATALLKIGGALRRRGATYPVILAALRQANVEICEPPKDGHLIETLARRIAGYQAEDPAVPGENGRKPGLGDLPDGYPPNDLGNALRFVRDHGDSVRYVYDMGKWIAHTQGYWPIDEAGVVEELAKETAQGLVELTQEQDEGEQGGDDGQDAAKKKERRKAMLRFALTSGNSGKLEAMVELSRTLLPIPSAQLDEDEWVLNCTNGLVDLRTGRLTDMGSRFVTKRAGVAYDPDAKCPTWEAFVARIMGDDKEKVRFVQQACGYALTGSIHEQCIFVLWGGGGNGKTALIETVRAILGEYARNADISTFEYQGADRVRSDLARLAGSRLVTTSEGEDGAEVSEATIKKVTGGEPITAAFKFRDEFEYRPRFKVFWISNHRPDIRRADKGIWRRIRLIPFTVEIPQSERRPLADVVAEFVRSEGPGILAWMVRGCLEWQRESLVANPPVAVAAATAEYREEMNVLGEFLSATAYFDAGASCSVAALYREYVNWCEVWKEKPMSKIRFGNRLREQGAEQRKGTGGKRLWSGVGLLNEDQARLDEVAGPSATPTTAAGAEAARYLPPAERMRTLVAVLRALRLDPLVGVDEADLKMELLSRGIAESYAVKDIARMLEQGQLRRIGESRVGLNE